ncbi:MAG TPA: hypothetical protein VF516_43340 [Kofleriaceae bacterium]
MPVTTRIPGRHELERHEHLGARHLPVPDGTHLFERRLEQRMVAGADQIDVDCLELDLDVDVGLAQFPELLRQLTDHAREAGRLDDEVEVGRGARLGDEADRVSADQRPMHVATRTPR